MAKKPEPSKCIKKGCDGTMTFYKRLEFKGGQAKPGAFPKGSRAGKGGWICNVDATHFLNEKP